MDTQELNQLWKAYQLKVTDEIAKSPEVLFCNGSAIGTLGNFSASTRKESNWQRRDSPRLEPHEDLPVSPCFSLCVLGLGLF